MYQSSNPPPLNTSFSPVTPSKRTSDVFEPYVLHIITSVIRDLQFLQQQGCISHTAYGEIMERLPKPVTVNAPPHTPPAPSPSTSPIPQPESPAVSTKSNTSQKHNSTVSTPQRPLSASSQTSQRQEQPLRYSLVQNKHNVEEIHQNQQETRQISVPQRRPTPPQLSASPSPLHNTPPLQPQLQQNQDGYHESKPAIPSRVSSFQPISPPQSVPNASSNIVSNTGAILATRPLPLPPNASSTSPPRPQPLPVFNNKYEEVEYERSMNHQRDFKDTTLPPYSVSIVEAMWDFMSDDPGDLPFNKGEFIEVVEYVNLDWWKGRIQGTSKVGIFPKIYTKILTRHALPDQPVANNAAYFNRLPQHSNTYSSSQPMHPPYQRSQHSPSLQNQQLPHTQHPQQLPPTQQNYTTYVQLQQHPQSAYANHVPDPRYLNSRNSTSSLNGQNYFRQDL